MLKTIELILEFILPKTQSTKIAENTKEKKMYELFDLRQTNGHIYFFPRRNRIVKAFMKSFKYEYNKTAIKMFSEILFSFIESEAIENANIKNRKTIITYIPDSKHRIKEQGYSHLFEISKQLKKQIKNSESNEYIKVEKLLKWKNKEEMIADKIDRNSVYVIYDDFFKTGKTFKKAKEALEKKGVKEIITIALSH